MFFFFLCITFLLLFKAYEDDSQSRRRSEKKKLEGRKRVEKKKPAETQKKLSDSVTGCERQRGRDELSETARQLLISPFDSSARAGSHARVLIW